MEPLPQLMIENATPVSISVCVCVVPNESWVCVPVVNCKPMELQSFCKEEKGRGLPVTWQCSFPFPLFLLILEALFSETKSFMLKEEREGGA